jgi:DNA-binding IclR family transcriptional regulator
MPVRETMSDERYLVPALERGLAIITMFSRGRHVLSVPEIVEQLGISRATAFRLAYTLEACGFIERLPSSHAFQIGARAVAVALDYLHSFDAAEIALPLLQRLRDATGATAQLAVRERTSMLYIVRAVSPDRQQGVGPGLPRARHEAHAVASGRALLYDLPEQQLEELYRDFAFAAYAPPAAQNLDELRQQLLADRRQGYVVCRSVFTQGVTSIAAPVRNGDGMAVAAVAVSGLTLSTPVLEQRARDQVLEAAALISVGLGYRSRTTVHFG